MNKITTWVGIIFCLLYLPSCNHSNNNTLFSSVDLNGWKTSGNVLVKDSMMILSGSNAIATLQNREYKDFDLKLKLRTTQNGKGSIDFHTDGSKKGYQVAINNDMTDSTWWRKTGSLLSVRNLAKSLAKDGEWFDMDIRVEGQSISIKVNGTLVVEYIEPAHPYRIPPNDKALLSSGTIAIESSGEGDIEIKDITIEEINSKNINITAQLAIASDEQSDDFIHLHQEDFPLLDYHVHLKGGLTSDMAIKQSRRLGVNYAIAPNCGIGFPITNDQGIYQFLDSMRSQPFILAMQAEGREWVTTFSEQARNEFDYVFTDALTFNDKKGRRVRLWIDNEVFIDNEQEFMDLIVDKTCDVLTEPADIFVNPCYLPDKMSDRYDAFWTEDRMNKFIEALAKSGKALEINELYSIPNKAIIMKAKEAGVKFTFGSNNVTPDVSKLKYSIKMKQECGLTAKDMYKPKIKI